MKKARAAVLLAVHSTIACGTPPHPLSNPTSVVPSARVASTRASVPAAETCMPRAETSGGALFALEASERSKRVQAALTLKYPVPVAQPKGKAAPDYPDPTSKREFVFKLLPKRWGAEGPVPWEEVAMPSLQRFIGPIALYYTQLMTGELEYPWVSGLVVARQPEAQLELSFVPSPSFSGSTSVIEPLLLAACAGSPALRSQLTLALREMYALGGDQPGESTTQDGSCTVTDYHLYEDVWRYLAIDFSVSGRVRHVYEFNPMNDEDSLRRRNLCTDHAAEP